MITHAKLFAGAVAAAGLITAPCGLCAAGASSTPGQLQIESMPAADTATVRLHISGMTCGSCATTARLALKKLDGVQDATVTLKDSLGVVRYDPRKVSPAQIVEHLTRLTGYDARVIAEPAGAAPAVKPGEASIGDRPQ